MYENKKNMETWMHFMSFCEAEFQTLRNALSLGSVNTWHEGLTRQTGFIKDSSHCLACNGNGCGLCGGEVGGALRGEAAAMGSQVVESMRKQVQTLITSSGSGLRRSVVLNDTS